MSTRYLLKSRIYYTPKLQHLRFKEQCLTTSPTGDAPTSLPQDAPNASLTTRTAFSAIGSANAQHLLEKTATPSPLRVYANAKKRSPCLTRDSPSIRACIPASATRDKSVGVYKPDSLTTIMPKLCNYDRLAASSCPVAPRRSIATILNYSQETTSPTFQRS